MASKNSSNDSNLLDKMAKKILSNIDPNYDEKNALKSRNNSVQSIMARQLELTKGISGGNIVDFITSMDTRMNGYLYKNRVRDDNMRSLNYDNLFTENIGDVFNYFQSVYKNKHSKLTDLKLISKFIPSMGKAVKICLSSICKSDDVSDTLIRSIIFPDGVDPKDKDIILNSVKNIETELKLKKKLKNTVYKNTLIQGEYYVYAKSYADIFNEYDKLDAAGYFKRTNFGDNIAQNTRILRSRRDSGFVMNSPAKESISSNPNDEFDDIHISIADESLKNIINSYSKEERAPLEEYVTKELENSSVTFHKSTILLEALESRSRIDTFDKVDAIMDRTNEDLRKLVTTDATANMNINKGYAYNGRSKNSTAENSKIEITGTYVKYIEAKKLLPLEIYEQTVGYFYMYTTPRKTSTVAYSSKNAVASVFNGSTNASERAREDVIANIADVISTGIMTNFSKDFVIKFSEYKELIAECLMSEGFANNDFHIQFIPASDIIKFSINEDEDGHGMSILDDALFPAKFLTDIIICKLLLYFNKSGNTKIAHVHKGPIDMDSYNQIQRTLRMLQDSSINFNDLLASNLLFSKFSKEKNMQLPTAANGAKLVEFEQMDGQDIDMSTPMEDKLEKMAIQGTPVPASFMETVDDIHFSRQIVSDHIEFAGVISDFQVDLEGSTTQLYRILLNNTQLSEKQKKIAMKIEFKLPRPKVLQNSNNSEYINTAISIAKSFADITYGEDSSSDKTIQLTKTKYAFDIVKDLLPFVEWDKYEEYNKNAKLKVAKEMRLEEKDDETYN